MTGNRRVLRSVPAALLALLGAAAAAPAAERHALIIGASDYALLPAKGEAEEGPFDLDGPGNDVARVIGMAGRLGVTDDAMTVLADDGEAVGRRVDGAPTRAEILAALDDLARRVGEGDFVLFYFSGHGSQQPDDDGDEADGLDEILLPIDIGPWDDTVGSVENAISDDELGGRIDRLRARGASVWVIVDACHSGTALRGGAMPADVEIRMVPASALGIPERGAATRGGSAPVDPEAVDESWTRDGRVTAFYGATSTTSAMAARWMLSDGMTLTPVLGLLTHSITEAVASGRVRTYRELALRVRGRFEDERSLGVAPAFEGEFDTPIFGHGDVPPRQWTIARRNGRLVADGGVLDGLHEGAILRVLAKGSGGDGVLAYVRVERTAPRTAELSPVAHGGLGADAADAIRSLQYVAETEVPAVPRVVRITAARSSSGAAARLAEALDVLAARPELLGDVRIERVPEGAPADLHLIPGDERIWLADRPRSVASAGRLPFVEVSAETDGEAVAEALAARLRAFARVKTLLGVVGELETGGALDALRVELLVDRVSTTHPSGRWPESESCPDTRSVPREAPASAVPLDRLISGTEDGTALRHCDVVYLRITNGADAPVDVTPLYIDREFAITPLRAGVRDARILPGASQTTLFQINTVDAETGQAYPLGLEHVVVIAVPQPSDEVPTTSYAFLAQPPAVPLTRGASVDPVLGMLDGAAATRSDGAAAPSVAFRYGLRIAAD